MKEKAKILFIVDKPGWAHDFKTDNIIRQLGHLYDTEKVYCGQVESQQIQNADLILIYYWIQLCHESIKKQLSILKRNQQKIMMGITSHRILEGELGKLGIPLLKQFAAGIFINSKLLMQEHGDQFDVPVFYAPNGVDTDFYTPREKTKNSTKMIVGWAGSLTNHGRLRGYHDFIVPAVELVDGVELLTAAREDKWRNKEEMREFYQQLDLYICASSFEGTPNPCLEAMACGVPLLSTVVGNMPELIQPGINGNFIKRDVEDISDKIRQLRDNRALLSQLGQGARATIRDWDWGVQAKNYQGMFEKMMEKGNPSVSKPGHSMSETLYLFQRAQEYLKGGSVCSKKHSRKWRVLFNSLNRTTNTFKHIKHLKDIYVYWMLLRSGLIDREYYLRNNPDVAQNRGGPIWHYLRYGWREGRNPNEYFNTAWYLRTYPDVAESGINPLYHYLVFGWKENRDPSEDFSTHLYLSLQSDIKQAVMNPLTYVIKYGRVDGRKVPSSLSAHGKEYVLDCPVQQIGCPVNSSRCSEPKSKSVGNLNRALNDSSRDSIT